MKPKTSSTKLSNNKFLFRDFTEKAVIIMQVSEKLKFIRHIKQWSQEEVAHRLNISASAYGSIERGETKLSLGRLEELAKVFDIELTQLLDSDEKKAFNFGGTHSHHNQNWYNCSESEQVIKL